MVVKMKQLGLDELADELEVLEHAADEIGVETSGVIVEGDAFVSCVSLMREMLWSTEEDDRHFDEEKNDYTETVLDYVMRKLEERALFQLKVVSKAREIMMEPVLDSK